MIAAVTTAFIANIQANPDILAGQVEGAGRARGRRSVHLRCRPREGARGRARQQADDRRGARRLPWSTRQGAPLRTRVAGRPRPGCAVLRPAHSHDPARCCEPRIRLDGALSSPHELLEFHARTERDRDDARVLFGQTMGLVAVTAALFAVGAYLGRNMSYGWRGSSVHRRVRLPARHERGDPAVGAARDRAAVRLRRPDRARRPRPPSPTTPRPIRRRSGRPAVRPRSSSPASAQRATRRVETSTARALLFWALLALIVFGIVTIFVRIPNGSLIYAILGLVIFAGFTMVDFQRLRRRRTSGPRRCSRRRSSSTSSTSSCSSSRSSADAVSRR